MKNFESFSTDWRVPDPTLQILIHWDIKTTPSTTGPVTYYRLSYNNSNWRITKLNLSKIFVRRVRFHAGQCLIIESNRNCNSPCKVHFQNNILSFKKHAWQNKISLFTEAPLCKWDEMVPPMTCSWQMTHPFFGMTDSHDTPRAKDRTHRVLTQWVSGSWHHSRGSRHLRRPPFRWGVTGIGWAHPIC